MKKRFLIALLTLPVVTALGVLLWKWKNEQNVQVSQNIAQKETQDKLNQINLVWYEIPELGISFKTDRELADDLVYFYPNKGKNASVTFSSIKLEKLGADCGRESGPLGIISKIEGKVSDHNTNKWNYFDGKLTKQFNDFFIFYSGPQAICGNSPEQWNNFFEENPKLRGWTTGAFDTIEIIKK